MRKVPVSGYFSRENKNFQEYLEKFRFCCETDYVWKLVQNRFSLETFSDKIKLFRLPGNIPYFVKKKYFFRIFVRKLVK